MPDVTPAAFSPFALRLPAEVPALLDSRSSWTGHLPFAAWIVAALRPASLVELGVYTGVSYCAFCEEVQRQGLATRCRGIDTWAGDPQAGFYGERILRALAAHHDPRYGAFSTLERGEFDSAAAATPAGSVDLLHIDGFHSYDAVRHDFETWAPKLSDRAVVLFHDIAVRQEGFGVHRFWDEVRQGRPHLAFSHSAGLGVLGMGRELPPPVHALLTAEGTEATQIRAGFEALGARLQEIQKLRRRIAKLEWWKDMPGQLRGLLPRSLRR